MNTKFVLELPRSKKVGLDHAKKGVSAASRNSPLPLGMSIEHALIFYGFLKASLKAYNNSVCPRAVHNDQAEQPQYPTIHSSTKLYRTLYNNPVQFTAKQNYTENFTTIPYSLQQKISQKLLHTIMVLFTVVQKDTEQCRTIQ